MTSPVIWHATRYARKPGKPGEEVTQLHLDPFPAPFDRRHSTDAHFWPYVAYQNGKPAELQISLPVQNGKVRGIDPGAGEAVMCHVLVLEWDSADHGAMDKPSCELVAEALTWLAGTPLERWSVVYFTRAGLRLVYRLSRPLHYERYREKVRGAAMMLQEATTLEVDPTCDQWWRCYRLPAVVRDDGKDDGPTWDREYYQLLIDEEATLDPDEIPSREARLPWDHSQSSLHADVGDMPEPARCLELAKLSSPFWRHAKKQLKAFDVYPYLFEAQDLEPGTRDSACVRFSGQAVAGLFNTAHYITAEHVFGLMLPMVTHLEPDQGEPREVKLWRLISHAWNCEAEKEVQKEQERLEQRDTTEDLCDRVLANFDERLFPADRDARRTWALKHLIAVYGNNCYVMSSDGKYAVLPLRTAQVSAHFRDQFPFLHIHNEKGNLRSGQELCNDFGWNCGEVRYAPGDLRGARVVLHQDEPTLEIVPYAIRQDVLDGAAHDTQINQYLEKTGCYDQLCEWFSHAPAIHEGGIAALSLKGAKGTGKTMMALAIAELFGAAPVSVQEAFGRFNAGCLRTPIVLGDEGIPRKIEGMSVADLFRSMVTGTTYPIEIKFGGVLMSSIPMRFVFTSNNMDLLKNLAGGRVLTREDTEALALRIRHLDINNEAADWLAMRGQMALTRWDPAGPWIGGEIESGGCRFARHIAWLYLQARGSEFGTQLSQRLLVEGEFDSRVAAMLEGGGIAPEVAQQICEDVERIFSGRGGGSALEVLHVHDCSLWIRKQEYVQRVVEHLGVKGYRAAHADARKVLNRWCTGREIDVVSGTGIRRRYWEISVQEIINIAEVESIDHTALTRVVSEDTHPAVVNGRPHG